MTDPPRRPFGDLLLVPARLVHLARFVLGPYLLVVGLVLFWPGSPAAAGSVPVSDDLGHLVLFAGLAALGYAALREVAFGWRVLSVGAFSVGFAFVSELVQILIPGRSFQWSDVVADVIGVGLGLGLTLLYQRMASGVAERERGSDTV